MNNGKTSLYKLILFIICAVGSVNLICAENDDDKVEDESEDNIVIVQGTYLSALTDAFEDKRLADQVLDSVSAENIGKLPDISIAEAIARIPGVVANRDRGNATELSVRGLGPNLTNTLLNGREIASGEPSRNVRYETYPAELLQGAYVYKSPTAKQVEGGVGGTIDLRTIKPLDYEEQKIVINGRTSFFEIADDIEYADAVGYTGSFSYIDQFIDDTLGVVLAYAFREQPTATASTTIFSSVARSEFANPNTQVFDEAGVQYLPYGFDIGIRGGEDNRDGWIGALQWKPSDTFQSTFDVFYSSIDFTNPSVGIRVNGVEGEFGNIYSSLETSSGYITSGTIEQTAPWGMIITPVNEIYTLEDELTAGGLNLNWNFDELTISSDIGYSENIRDAEFVSVQSRIHAYDNSGTPFVVDNGTQASFRSLASGRSLLNFNVDLSDSSIILPAQVSVPDSDTVVDEILSYRLDTEYKLSGDFFTLFNFGIRLTDREKSLVARSDSPWIDPSLRTSIPDNLLRPSITNAGSVTLPAVINFDRQGVINQLFGGINPIEQDFNKTESWLVEEDLLATYLSVSFEGDMGSIPFSGNIGVRSVKTETIASSTFLQNGQETNFQVVLTPFSVEKEYTDTLPSLNIAFFPNETSIFRLGVSKAIARPPLDDMNAGVGEFNFGTPEAFGGNPDLEPFRADQIDLSYEWYGEDKTVFTVSAFHKEIETFILRQTLSGVTLPSGAVGNFTQPINGEGGNLTGSEIAFSQALGNIIESLDGFGIYLNYSYIDSNIEVGPAFVVGSYSLPGLAENTFNSQIWYYNDGLEARLGYRYNDAYATELGDAPGAVMYSDEAEIVDFQLSYAFSDDSQFDGLKLLFQANNLTNEPFKTYYGDESVRGRYEEYGKRFWMGFSYEL